MAAIISFVVLFPALPVTATSALAPAAANLAGERLQGACVFGHRDQRRPPCRRSAGEEISLDDRARGATFQRLPHELVPIKSRSAHGEE